MFRAIAGISFLCLCALAALALPACSLEWDYYSDATFKTMVGDKEILCDGHRFQSGSVTNYYEKFTTGDCQNCPPVDFFCANNVIVISVIPPPPGYQGQSCQFH